jgi:glucose/arabinose dehydrogenase
VRCRRRQRGSALPRPRRGRIRRFLLILSAALILVFGLVLGVSSVIMVFDPDSHLARGYLVYVAKNEIQERREWLHDLFSSEPGRKNFAAGILAGTSSEFPTSLQFGPDGRLYVAQQDGKIKAYTIRRLGAHRYRVSETEVIEAVRAIPNHNDDGRLAPKVKDRQVTGILVKGLPRAPEIYVTSSDPRIGGGEELKPTNADTNSGVLSLLTRTDRGWQRRDLVRGLPRSRENHSTNGMALDAATQTLYLAQGGNVNEGAPSAHFGLLPQYALSSAILRIDLRAIGTRTYDLPTLDDREKDAHDPFGGDDGRNQARLVADGPVQLRATGFRNPYDVLLTRTGRMYVVDNGGNAGWGDVPVECTNRRREGGDYELDTLHFVSKRGYYGGHPNPTRGSKANVFGPRRESPVAVANPNECQFVPISKRGIAHFVGSTNGLTEYSAKNLDGALRGDLLTVSFDGHVTRLELNEDGTEVDRKETFRKIPAVPLDIVAEGDADPFPGTIWIVSYGTGRITVLEPDDFLPGRWVSLAPSGVPRAEVSYVRVRDRFYVAGGHSRRQQVYDPGTNDWRDVAPFPASLDHIQAVAIGERIYYIGGLRRWPEPEVGSVLIYDTRTNTFRRGAPMPRARGAGGVAVHSGLIYYAGGLHGGEAVPWFDVYDPASDRWSRLPDMPRAREHFHAAVATGKLYAIGGRMLDIGATVSPTDAYDFSRHAWITGFAPMPTERAGFAAAVIAGRIVIIGGENAAGASDAVESYDPQANAWRKLAPMPTARHGIEAVACNGAAYVVDGGTAQGGGHETAVHEALFAGVGEGCG